MPPNPAQLPPAPDRAVRAGQLDEILRALWGRHALLGQLDMGEWASLPPCLPVLLEMPLRSGGSYWAKWHFKVEESGDVKWFSPTQPVGGTVGLPAGIFERLEEFMPRWFDSGELRNPADPPYRYGGPCLRLVPPGEVAPLRYAPDQASVQA